MQPKIQTEVPWHWHDAFEIELIHHGTITLFDQTASHQLKEGDLCLIRPQALHALKSEHCEFYAHLFAPDFLSGDQASRIWQTGFAPLLRDEAPDVLLFKRFFALACTVHRVSIASACRFLAVRQID